MIFSPLKKSRYNDVFFRKRKKLNVFLIRVHICKTTFIKNTLGMIYSKIHKQI